MISEKQKKKLRSILEKISTPEELRAFDMEVLGDKQDKTKQEIIDKIEKNKTQIDWGFVSNLIAKAQSAIIDRIDEIKNKKYPTYDDTELKKQLESIESEVKESSFVKVAKRKSEQGMANELIHISEILLNTQEILGTKKDETDISFLRESLIGIGDILQKILSKTGTSLSQKIQNSSGTIINPATEETLQSVAGMDYDNVTVDTSASPVIIVTRKMGTNIVSVKTINII